MNRLDNWQSNLSAVILARRERAFEWGATDCTQFAFDAIKAVTGIDRSAPNRGKYNTPKGALKRLQKDHGVKTPAEYMAKYYGEMKPVAFARKGDVVTCDPGRPDIGFQEGTAAFGPAIGVCYGQMSYFCGETGLVAVPTLECDGCFHILLREGE